MELLLLSTPKTYKTQYLQYAMPPLKRWLGDAKHLLFIPYALQNHARYTSDATAAFHQLGVTVTGIHTAADPLQAVANATHIFVGGGNTFRLLQQLQNKNLLGVIRERVLEGTLNYAGASAGVNVACPTIRTTNDMPIVQPATLNALDLIPFQINPHYLDPQPNFPHMGETREERIQQFLEENTVPVLGLREGGWVRLSAGKLTLEGKTSRLFTPNHNPTEISPGTNITWLMSTVPHFDNNQQGNMP